MRKIRQSGGFLGRILGSLLSLIRLPLIRNVLKPLDQSVLIPLGLTSAVSATASAFYKKMFGLDMATLIISNEEMNDIMKKVKSLEESCLLIKCVRETIKNEAKGQKDGFHSMLLGTLGTSLVENLLKSKAIIRAG